MKLIEFRTIERPLMAEGTIWGNQKVDQSRQRVTKLQSITSEWGLEDIEVLTQEWGEWEDMP